MAYDETDHLLLHRFFRVNADKIGKELLSYPSAPGRDPEIAGVSGKQTWDVLCATLVEIGDPEEIPPPTGPPLSQNMKFKDFLAKAAHRNTDGVRDIFVASGDNRVGLYALVHSPTISVSPQLTSSMTSNSFRCSFRRQFVCGPGRRSRAYQAHSLGLNVLIYHHLPFISTSSPRKINLNALQIAYYLIIYLVSRGFPSSVLSSLNPEVASLSEPNHALYPMFVL